LKIRGEERGKEKKVGRGGMGGDRNKDGERERTEVKGEKYGEDRAREGRDSDGDYNTGHRD